MHRYKSFKNRRYFIPYVLEYFTNCIFNLVFSFSISLNYLSTHFEFKATGYNYRTWTLQYQDDNTQFHTSLLLDSPVRSPREYSSLNFIRPLLCKVSPCKQLHFLGLLPLILPCPSMPISLLISLRLVLVWCKVCPFGRLVKVVWHLLEVTSRWLITSLLRTTVFVSTSKNSANQIHDCVCRASL